MSLKNLVQIILLWLSIMKKHVLRAHIVLLLFLYIVFSPYTLTAYPVRADAPSTGDYACILSENTYFYSTADERRGLFLLPKTYYVRLIEYGTDYSKIEYQTDDGAIKKLVGYVKTKELTFVNYTPTRPYLSYIFEVTYTIGGAEPQTASAFLDEITLSCVYYGDYQIGTETYCYVLRGDTFGYIPKPPTLSYEENGEYADYLASLPTDSPSEEPPSSTPPQNNAMQTAILIAVCLLVPVLAALILRSPQRPPYETEE